MKTSKAMESFAFSGKLNSIIELLPLENDDYERFVRDYQRAFLAALTKAYGRRKHYYSYTEEIIPDKTIEALLKERYSRAYRIMIGDAPIGGAAIRTMGVTRGRLDLLFVAPCAQGCGIGVAAWEAIERLHPCVNVWEATVAFFERKNLHFLVNHCGFYIVEYYNRHRPNPNVSLVSPGSAREDVFRLEKSMLGRDI